jgi:uncharacterized protein
MIRNELKEYIEKNIFKQYEKNEKGHGIEHIKYVIKRSLKFSKQIENINEEMVYTVAAYHDIGHHIDKDNHEKISAQILLKDNNLKEFFTQEQINTMAIAVEDHRASNKQEPRNIYGKIVSSADRNTSVEEMLKRTYSYNKKHYPNLNEEEIIKECYKHLKNKYGKDGYATKKMYFQDEEYDNYLKKIDELTQDIETFFKETEKIK